MNPISHSSGKFGTNSPMKGPKERHMISNESVRASITNANGARTIFGDTLEKLEFETEQQKKKLHRQINRLPKNDLVDSGKADSCEEIAQVRGIVRAYLIYFESQLPQLGPSVIASLLTLELPDSTREWSPSATNGPHLSDNSPQASRTGEYTPVFGALADAGVTNHHGHSSKAHEKPPHRIMVA
ncbi:hypothetical protein PMIN06_002469 [Paraphaeosphaeria minitans]